MAVQDAPATPARLDFGATFRAAFSSVFGRFGQFVRLAIIPLLLALAVLITDVTVRALMVVGSLQLDPFGLGAVLLQLATGLLALLPFAILGIALTRQSYGGAASHLLPSPLLGRRTWAYAGYLLLLLLSFIVLVVGDVFAILAVLEALSPLDDSGTIIMVFTGLAGFLVLLYLLLRFSLVLPAVALDDKLGLIGSWRLTRRSGMKLLGAFLLLIAVLLLAMVIGSAITGGGEIHLGTPTLAIPEGTGPGSDWVAIVMANVVGNLWNLVVNIVVFAMGCGAIASAYVQLSGRGSARAEILQRFE